MKKQALRIFLAVGLFAVLSASAAQAQTGASVVVRVPFEFHVGDERLPAGTYTVAPATQNGSRALALRSADGRATKVVLTDDAKGGAREGERARFDFHRYGGSYFLRQVVTPGASRALRESSLERETARESAAPRRGLARSRQLVSLVSR